MQESLVEEEELEEKPVVQSGKLINCRAKKERESIHEAERKNVFCRLEEDEDEEEEECLFVLLMSIENGAAENEKWSEP